MRSGQFDRAVADFAELVEQQADQSYYHYWLAMALIRTGDCSARSSMARAIQLNPSWGEAHLALARIDAVCGWSEAASRRAVSLLQVRDDADTRLTLAFAELAKGDTDKARQLAEQELPHADADMLLDNIEGKSMALPFAAGSVWWHPAEVR
jgi:Flp pilus assembly protein TadD